MNDSYYPIQNPVKLGFDPNKIDDRELAEVFADDVARTFWLAWRPFHLVNQHFSQDCLQIARAIRQRQPKTPEDLRLCVPFNPYIDGNFIASELGRFCVAALPYFTGEKKLAYQFDLSKRPVVSFWTRAWTRLGADPATEQASKALIRLIEAYNEPHRRYHTLQHIEDGLELLTKLGFDVEGGPPQNAHVVLAWLYHDYVYNPLSALNEVTSANNFNLDCYTMSIPQHEFGNISDEVSAMILATTHKLQDYRNDCFTSLVLDLDLAPLGADWETFDQQNEDLREEYEKVPEVNYYRGNTAFLLRLLQRPSIFRTMRMLELFEAQARANLIRLLGGGGLGLFVYPSGLRLA